MSSGNPLNLHQQAILLNRVGGSMSKDENNFVNAAQYKTVDYLRVWATEQGVKGVSRATKPEILAALLLHFRNTAREFSSQRVGQKDMMRFLALKLALGDGDDSDDEPKGSSEEDGEEEDGTARALAEELARRFAISPPDTDE